METLAKYVKYIKISLLAKKGNIPSTPKILDKELKITLSSNIVRPILLNMDEIEIKPPFLKQ